MVGCVTVVDCGPLVVTVVRGPAVVDVVVVVGPWVVVVEDVFVIGTRRPFWLSGPLIVRVALHSKGCGILGSPWHSIWRDLERVLHAAYKIATNRVPADQRAAGWAQSGNKTSMAWIDVARHLKNVKTSSWTRFSSLRFISHGTGVQKSETVV